MFKTLVIATAAVGFSLAAASASAGQSNTAGEVIKPGQSMIKGGGCHQDYPAPQSVKPSA